MTKDELIEKYAEINVDYDWWEGTYENFIEDMEKVGIEVDDISFTGFWSQGDHATFSCNMRSSVDKFIENHNLHKQYNAIYMISLQGGVRIHKKLDKYSEVDCEAWQYFDVCADEDMNEYYKKQYEEEVELTFTDFHKDVIEILEGYEDDLYRKLRDEYEYLTSYEAVWDSIVANDLHEESDEFINRGLQLGETT